MLHGMFARQFGSLATRRLQRRLPFLCIARMGVSDHHFVCNNGIHVWPLNMCPMLAANMRQMALCVLGRTRGSAT